MRSTKKKTTEEFKLEVQEKFGDTYILDKVHYINSHTKVTLICKKHGEFEITPTNLLHNNRGCPKCAKEKDKTEQLFLAFKEKVIQKYGDIYDFYIEDYKNCKTKMPIYCRKHGVFYITPDKLLNEYGCLKCSKEKKQNEYQEKILSILLNKYGAIFSFDKTKIEGYDKEIIVTCNKHGDFITTPRILVESDVFPCQKCKKEKEYDDFVKQANIKHNNKYRYVFDDFGKNGKVTVICPKHGEFSVSILKHLKGTACAKCAYDNKRKFYSKEELISKFREVHGNTYSYSEIEKYQEDIPCSSVVPIICPIHGLFYQKIKDHLLGKGCRKCCGKDRTTEDFIHDAREIHGDKYDYSKVYYTRAIDKVCIICPEHGEFWQKPYKHLLGHGCPKCKQSHLERLVDNYLTTKDIQFLSNDRKTLNGLELDFHLKSLNIAIECQGEQHFFPKEFYGCDNIEEKSQLLVQRDINKSQMCKEKGIMLYYIIPSKVKINDILNNPKYNNIYTENNCVKEQHTIEFINKILNNI